MPVISSRRLGALRLVVPIFLVLLPGLSAGKLLNMRHLSSPAGRLPAAAPADTVRGGGLTGRLRNLAGQPLEYANVLLLRAADSTLVRGTLSNEQGRFAFADVPAGRYRVRAQQLGYRDGRSAVVQVAGGAPLALPPLVLAPAAQALAEVLVTGRKPVIERQIDRLVVNVDQLPAVAGGSAYDVLKSTPGVTVSATDAIGMQGKSGVLVLIDDRPVRLSPDALANMLRNMPAESIQTLEVITTPPAKYDAEGNAGILNIRTRQRQQPGWSTDLTLREAQGHYSRYSGGAVVGIKRKRVEFNGSYFLGRTRSFEDITQYATRRVPGQPLPSELQAVSHRVSTARYHDAKAQLEVKTGAKSSAGLVATLYVMGNPAEGTGTARTFTAAQPSDTTVLTQSRLDSDSYNYSVDGYYTLRLDSAGKSVSVDANYARFGTDQQQDFTNQTVDEARAQPVGGSEQLRSGLVGSTLIHSLKADVTLPFPTLKLETGAKYSQVAAANDFLFQREQGGMLVADAGRTNQFAYQENIYAAYVSASRDWSKLSLQLGLRAEYTRALGTSRTTQTSTRNNYFQLFPTVYAQYKFSPAYQLNLSYSRRIERPAYSSLNPFLSYQSRYFSNQGNPFLLPSFTDAVEWTNVFAHELSVAPFFNYTRQFASEYPLQNGATRETTYTYGNLGYAYNYGVTLVAPFALGKRWKVDNDLTVYEQAFHSTYAAEPQHRRLLVYNLSVTNSFTLTPHLTAQLSGYYHSPTIQGFYRSVSYYALNAGATLKLLDNKAILSLSLADLLYTERGAADVHYASQDFGFYRRNDTRLLRLAFTYKLGNTGLTRKSQREAAGQEERNRAN
jgi:outer membrane receptor for ferrienterochelin and colicin